jgi:hypothetical protein
VCVCAHSRGDSPQGTSIHMDFRVMHVSERASMSGKKHQCCYCIYILVSNRCSVTSSDCCMTYMFRKQACNPSNTMAQFPHCGCGYGVRIVCHVYMLSCWFSWSWHPKPAPYKDLTHICWISYVCVLGGIYTLHSENQKNGIYIYTISIKYCHNWTYIPHLQIPKLIKPSPHDSGACNKLKGLCLSTRYPPKIQRVSYFMFYLTFQKFGASPQHWNKLLCIYKSCVYVYTVYIYSHLISLHFP